MQRMEDFQNDRVICCHNLLDAKVHPTAVERVGVRGTSLILEDYVPSYFVHVGADLGFAVGATEADVTAVAYNVHKDVFRDGLLEGNWRPSPNLGCIESLEVCR